MTQAIIPLQRGLDNESALRRTFSGSPGRLRLTAIGTVLAVLAAVVLGAVALKMRSDALDRVSASSDHLLLLRSIQTDLREADADATNGFLKAGLEPQEQRTQYTDALTAAARDLALASQHSRADAETLGAANAALAQYAEHIGAARANNRQGLNLGASYLKVATASLDADVIAKIEERASADDKAVSDAFGDAEFARWLVLLAVVVGVGGLAAAQVSISRRSHRYVNLPLAASTVVLVLALGGTVVMMTAAQHEANTVRRGSLATALELSASRVNAFNAKAAESLTLINQGSATDGDEKWTPSYNEALTGITGDSLAALKSYKEQHDAINAADLDGNWRGAVKLATSSADGSANAFFTTYDTTTAGDLEKVQSDASERLSTAGGQLAPTAIGLLLAGLIGAALAWWGVSFRLGEYR